MNIVSRWSTANKMKRKCTNPATGGDQLGLKIPKLERQEDLQPAPQRRDTHIEESSESASRGAESSDQNGNSSHDLESASQGVELWDQNGNSSHPDPASPSRSEESSDRNENSSDAELSLSVERASLPKMRVTKPGGLSRSPLRREHSWDLNERKVGSGSACSTGREGSPLQGAVANLIKIVKQKCDRSKQQVQDELTLLKRESVKRKMDLVVQRMELSAKTDSLILAQNELALKEEGLLCAKGELVVEKKKLLRVKGELNVERGNSHRLQSELAAQKERSVCLQEELTVEKDIVGCLRTQIQGLETKLHEAEAKIKDQAEKMLCEICFERPRNALCLPCMHLSFCILCLEQHLKTCKTCPICRVSTKGVLECYGLA